MLDSNALSDLSEETDHLDYLIAKLKPTGDALSLSKNYCVFGSETPVKYYDKDLKAIIDDQDVSVLEWFIYEQKKISKFNGQQKR